MLTVGGVIASRIEKEHVKAIYSLGMPFIQKGLGKEPKRIDVPMVTRREKLCLDNAMPCADGWKPEDFEMLKKDVKEYRKIYKYYPWYTEGVL